MRKIMTSLVVVAMLALPSVTTAQAQGNAGVDEYTEDVPGGGGNQPSGENGGSSGENGGSGATSDGGPLTSAQVAALEAQGKDGESAAALAQSTGPDLKGGKPGKGETNGQAGAGTEAGASPTEPDSGGSGIGDAVGDLVNGPDSGMGVLLPIILGLTLIAAVAFFLIRRKGRSPGAA